MVRLEIEGGIYEFKLDDILKKKGLSLNKIITDTNTDFKVLKRIMTGELVRFDIFVVARLCNYLDCSITDIIDYSNNQNVSWKTSFCKKIMANFTFAMFFMLLVLFLVHDILYILVVLSLLWSRYHLSLRSKHLL